jgi:predicted acetyltransferase
MVPWVIKRDPKCFEEMLELLHKDEDDRYIPEGWVSNSTYWLLLDNREIVGAVNIRHRLTEQLYLSGGHIGYGIRPSARRQGYATQLLALALKECKRLRVTNALVVCDADNVASRRTILSNGGVQDQDYIEPDGNVIHRFWIMLEEEGNGD